ncbi:MAG: hypothetical protein PHD51_01965 [Patescibacteria group bacterium]|nr:hypothetical protein [Patescibacteria group bacterium]MDD5490374.1 hypothetical protein [Patescibacteria group bacterium]
MFLFINTAEEERLLAGLISATGTILKAAEIKEGAERRESLLGLVDKLLLASKFFSEKIKGIIVVTGPGRFSRLRSAVVLANTLSFALGIPVAGMNLEEVKNQSGLIKKGIAKIKKGGDTVVAPFYGKEPNITRRKS